jgi:hypothetical protein
VSLPPLPVENARVLVWVLGVAVNAQSAWCVVVIAYG